MRNYEVLFLTDPQLKSHMHTGAKCLFYDQ